MEALDAELAAPAALWGLFDGRDQAVHVVPPVAIVTEEELVVVLAGAAQGAAFAFNALPGILSHRDDHVVGELQTSRMS